MPGPTEEKTPSPRPPREVRPILLLTPPTAKAQPGQTLKFQITAAAQDGVAPATSLHATAKAPVRLQGKGCGSDRCELGDLRGSRTVTAVLTVPDRGPLALTVSTRSKGVQTAKIRATVHIGLPAPTPSPSPRIKIPAPVDPPLLPQQSATNLTPASTPSFNTPEQTPLIALPEVPPQAAATSQQTRITAASNHLSPNPLLQEAASIRLLHTAWLSVLAAAILSILFRLRYLSRPRTGTPCINCGHHPPRRHSPPS